MNRIKDLREDKDLKQSDLAKIINTTQQNMSNYETGKTSPPQDIWLKLSDFFNVSVDYLMGKTNNPSNDSFTEDLTEEEIKELEHYKELLKIKRKVDNNKKISTLTNEK